MITLYRPSGYDSPRASSFAGRSVDDKPLDVENGSSFKEIDTGRVFRYDKDNNLWIAQKSTSGGAGATEPYIEETYDADGNLIGAKMYGYTKVRGWAFFGCSSLALIVLPNGLTSIGDNAFSYCSNLALTSLPNGLTSIGESAFANCMNLALTSLPESVTSIGGSAFAGCSSLTSITFKGTPSSITSSAFSGCTNLTDIKVPWSEGAVSGAPWGATNATITYNYTE